tara:strand:+ start:206 stop:817 length:612 start_codon:yes stop_codon:yes gene_type:complete
MQISYEITKDSRLLNEYYQVRERCYQQELKLPSFDGSEEPEDRDGNIFVAKNKDYCLGGARITDNVEALLSNMSLCDLMLKLDMVPGTCCAWERLAVSHEFRDSRSQPEFCDQLVSASRSLGYDYALMVSSVKNARFYRLCHSMLNIPFQICGEIECAPSGAFSQLEHVLSVAQLRPDNFSNVVAEKDHYFSPEYQPYYGVAA